MIDLCELFDNGSKINHGHDSFLRYTHVEGVIKRRESERKKEEENRKEWEKKGTIGCPLDWNNGLVWMSLSKGNQHEAQTFLLQDLSTEPTG